MVSARALAVLYARTDLATITRTALAYSNQRRQPRPTASLRYHQGGSTLSRCIVCMSSRKDVARACQVLVARARAS